MATTTTQPSSSNAPSVSFFGNTSLPPSRALAASTFLAGDEPVTIVPAFSLPEPLEMISGSIGPFRAGTAAPVPLWIATMLRRRKLARIVPPPWMDADALRGVLRFERDPREASFSSVLPMRHAEVARALLAACRTGSGTGSAAGGNGGDSVIEIPDADRVKILLEDIAAVRMEKIRRNVHQLSASTLSRRGANVDSVIDVTGIGSVEMHAVRPFVAESFRLHRELIGRGSSYSKDVEPDGSNTRSSGRATAASAGRGRLRQSKVRASDNAAGGEKEKLMEPRPKEEMEDETTGQGETDVNAGRSRLRRHR